MKKCTIFFILLIFYDVQLTKAQAPADTIGAGRDLQFNGDPANYIDLGDSYNSLNFPFTFEAWVDPTSYPGITTGYIFSSDNDVSIYYGWDVLEETNGAIAVRFGDGVGFGQDHRRGLKTANTIPLNTWTHVAIVFQSVTNVSIYFNGVLQSTNADDGTSTITNIAHSSGHAWIGSGLATDNFIYIGYIDEVRLWSDTLSQTTIRKNMCSKINPTSSVLIGYWKADEADSSLTVKDYSLNGINGTIVDTVTRAISDAPIGNRSIFLYSPDYSGASLQLGAASGDSLIVDQISGVPDGVQVYAVNSAPYDVTGLKSKPTSYFGVLCVNGSLSTYSIAYHYSLSDGVVNNANQDSLSLSRRPYTTFVPWLMVNGTLNTNQRIISQTGLISPQEYALNVPLVNSGVNQLTVNIGQLTVYPNPSSGVVSVSASKNIDELKVFNLLGQLVYEYQPKQRQFTFELKNQGMYFVTFKVEDEIVTRKIVVNR